MKGFSSQILELRVECNAIVVLSLRDGQPVLPSTGGVGLGMADTQRERRWGREGRRGDAKQASDRVSSASCKLVPSLLRFFCLHTYSVWVLLCHPPSQRSLHHPPGGVCVVWRFCHGHLLRSGRHTLTLEAFVLSWSECIQFKINIGSLHGLKEVYSLPNRNMQWKARGYGTLSSQKRQRFTPLDAF